MIKFLAAIIACCAFVSLPLFAEVIQTDNQQLKQLIEQGVAVIDVRTPKEWRETGVIPGSHLLTFFNEAGQYDAKVWLQQLEAIARPDQPLAIICAVGGRSKIISHFLDSEAGYKKVHNVTKGIREWIQAGNPTAKPDAQ
ncbi:MAG: rhodanese-like domain-containing protein [Gammaproteobacteria bacterium]